MYLSNDFCCICVSNKTDLTVLSNVDDDNISLYEKLTLSVPEMCFKGLTDEGLSCRECCDNIKIVYSFREKCLKSKIILVEFLTHASDDTEVNGVKEESSISILENDTIKEELGIEEEKNEDFSIDFVNFNNIKIEKNDNEDVKDNQEAYKGEESNNEGQNRLEVTLEENMEDEPATAVQVQLRDSVHRNVPKPNVCQTCYKPFTYPSHLKIHKKNHWKSKLHRCTICQITFKDFSLYLEHAVSHKIVGGFTCSDCGKRFSDCDTLAAHKETHRENIEERNFSCTICSRKFHHHGTWATHMKSHNRVKLECGIYRREFSKKSDLARHGTVHTGDRPFHCTICEKKYSQNNNLIKHMKTHSGDFYNIYC